MSRAALIVLAGALPAACGSAAPPSVVPPAQVAADAAAAAYAVCVDKAAAALDVNADQTPTLADRALKACVAERATVSAKVNAAGVAGGDDPMTARLVAERSVRVADSELRERANAAIVTRKLRTGG